jgi:hypothetical protein
LIELDNVPEMQATTAEDPYENPDWMAALEDWFDEVDRWVLQDGEAIVCPKICATCFRSDDALKDWYWGMSAWFRNAITTGPGCWRRFKRVMAKRFLADIAKKKCAR